MTHDYQYQVDVRLSSLATSHNENSLLFAHHADTKLSLQRSLYIEKLLKTVLEAFLLILKEKMSKATGEIFRQGGVAFSAFSSTFLRIPSESASKVPHDI